MIPPLTIRKVNNGYTVEYVSCPMDVITGPQVFVFDTWGAASNFIKDYFIPEQRQQP